MQELEKKFSQTGAYKNLKKMLASKNDQIKDLRQKLARQGQDRMLGADAEDEEEEEEEEEWIIKEASRYDVRMGGGGGHGKADVLREVAWILYYKSVPNADKGGGGRKFRKFCGCH